MFDELDPPEPFTPTTAFHTSVSRSVTRRRRTRRIATGAAGTLAVLLVVSAGMAGYGAKRWDDVHRVDVAATNPASLGGDPFTVLVAGVDGTGPDRHADSVAVVRVDPLTKSVKVLALPRDIEVRTPDTSDRPLRDVLAHGGPQALVESVEASVGPQIDRYVEVDEAGLAQIVDALGGVEIDVATPVRSKATGLHIATAGCTTLDGTSVVRLSRAKDLEIPEGNGWHSNETGDAGRLNNQQALASALLSVLGQHDDPVALAHVVDVALDHLTLDQHWSASDVVTLLEAMKGATFTSATVPTMVVDTADGAHRTFSAAGGDLGFPTRPDVQDPDPHDDNRATSGPAQTYHAPEAELFTPC